MTGQAFLPIACVILIALCGFLPVAAQEPGPGESSPDTEANMAVVVREFVEVWNQQKLDVIDEIYAPDNVFHDPAESGFKGPEGYRRFATMYLTAFPDAQFTIEEQIAAGDKVVTLWTATGTHKGELMGIPPTDVHAITTGINIARIADGHIVEEWAQWDALGQMQQLGAITPARPAPENYMWGAASEVTGDAGDMEANKAVLDRLTEEFWNQKNLDLLDETYSADSISHNPVMPGNPLSFDASKQASIMHLEAFPDMKVTIDDTVAEGDKIVKRWTVTGTHRGELMGLPASGKQATWTGMTIYRFVEGEIMESWWAYDALGMMQQITASPGQD